MDLLSLHGYIDLGGFGGWFVCLFGGVFFGFSFGLVFWGVVSFCFLNRGAVFQVTHEERD